MNIGGRLPAGRSEPGRFYPPPPLHAWDLVWRYGITITLALVVVLTYAPIEAGKKFLFLAVLFSCDITAGFISFILIRFRRRKPILIASILALFSLLSATSWGVALWALGSVATRRRWREVALPCLILVATSGLEGGFLARWLVPDEQFFADGIGSIGFFTLLGFTFVVCILMVVAGFYIGARRDLLASLKERAETAEREQTLVVEQGKAAERARIAREMHDVLAHRISLVSMHAGVLAFRGNLEPAERSHIASVIQENAHASLTELREVLRQLRDTDNLDQTPELPQPTLTDLAALFAESHEAGTKVHPVITIQQPELLPTPLGRHAYRIVQEALTNARKHSPGQPAWVNIIGQAGHGLEIVVRNRHAKTSSSVPGAKLGLVGLQERAELTGGTLRAGAEQGDFVVRAWLPWQM